MVLLKGLNYDFSNQQTTKLVVYAAAGSTSLNVEATTGFPSSGYVVLEPKTERAEIVAYSAITANTITTSATSFQHGSGEDLYLMPYNQMRFYYCVTADGTYTYITSSSTTMTYDQTFTNYEYAAGTTSLYYKRTFYNSTSLVETDIGVSDYWKVNNDQSLVVSAAELRVYLQFDENDYPSNTDMQTIINIAAKEVTFDVATSSNQVLYLAQLMMAKYYVLRGLASRALAKGYVQINAEGRQIIKAYNELAKEALAAKTDYDEFIFNNARTETGRTDFMDDLDDGGETRQNINDIQHGFSNAEDFGRYHKYSYGFRSRRS